MRSATTSDIEGPWERRTTYAGSMSGLPPVRYWLAPILLLLASACAAPEPTKAPEVPEATRLYEAGLGMARTGDSVRAEHYLNAAMQAGYPRNQVLPRLLDVCIRGSRLRSALNYALPALEQQPDDHQLRTLAATLYVGLGQPEKAKEELTTVLAMSPDMAPAHYLLATTNWEAFNDAEGARLHFKRYLELEPDSKRAKNAQLWLVRHPVSLPPSDGGAAVAASEPQASAATPPHIEPQSGNSPPEHGEGRKAREPTPIRASPVPSVQGIQ